MIVRRNRADREMISVGSTDPMEGRVIMGIDPGTNVLGYGVIEIRNGKAKCLILGVVALGKFKDRYQKLKHIFERVNALVRQYKPDEMALEAPFYGDNVQSMLKLGRAQGVAMAAALVLDVPVFEYAPRRIKQAITGEGGASKEQVAALLQKILEIETMPKELDATDGLAVAMCHYYFRSSPLGGASAGGGGSAGGASAAAGDGGGSAGGGSAGGWESFVNNNPNKVKL